MPYIFLLCSICASAMLAISGTLFNQKNGYRKEVSGLYNPQA